MTEFRHTLREMLESAIADMEELSAERHNKGGVPQGKRVLSKLAGPGGTGTSEQGELDGTPRPLQEEE